MADKNIVRALRAQRRRRRVRGKVHGNGERPRLTVAKSLKNISAQIGDDEKMTTLVGASSNSKIVIGELKEGLKKTEIATKVGEILARLAKEMGIEQVVFDRNQYRFHGRVKALADGARKGGLKF